MIYQYLRIPPPPCVAAVSASRAFPPRVIFLVVPSNSASSHRPTTRRATARLVKSMRTAIRSPLPPAASYRECLDGRDQGSFIRGIGNPCNATHGLRPQGPVVLDIQGEYMKRRRNYSPTISLKKNRQTMKSDDTKNPDDQNQIPC